MRVRETIGEEGKRGMREYLPFDDVANLDATPCASVQRVTSGKRAQEGVKVAALHALKTDMTNGPVGYGH